MELERARETVLAQSKAHFDMQEAVEHGRPWIKNGLRYRPVSARREGRVIVVELKLIK